jgi:hypothetical protein
MWAQMRVTEKSRGGAGVLCGWIQAVRMMWPVNTSSSLASRLFGAVVHLHELRGLLEELRVECPRTWSAVDERELRRCISEEQQLAEDLLYVLCRRGPPSQRALC